MKSRKFIALMLAALMCLPLLASCTDEPSQNTRPDGSSASGNDDQFPSNDYNGDKFTFLYIKHSDALKDYYGGNYIDSDSLEGLTIEDAVYDRNLAVEEKYHVEIEQMPRISGDPAAVLQEFIMSGDYSYDVIYGWCYKLGAAITENYFADFKELENNGTVKLDAEYWAPSAIDDLTVGGKLYLCTNDISMNKLNWAGMLFFNKNMAEDFNIEQEYLGGSTLYDLVRNKQWTLDKYLNLVKSVNMDEDGDGQISKEDKYGLIDGTNVGSALAITSGIKLIKTQDDGTMTLDIYSEKLLDIIGKVSDVYSNDKYVKTYDEIWQNADYSSYADQWEYARSYFTQGHSLFCAGSAYITSEFRNMSDEYGILPYPLYDENQENYISEVSSLASVFALPSTVNATVSSGSMERTGTILEYMAYKSNEILLPVYYDTLLKGQRLNSPDDSEMLDVIRGSVTYSLADALGFAEDSSPSTLMSNMFARPNAAKSTYDRNRLKVQKALDDFYAKVMTLDQKKAEGK